MSAAPEPFVQHAYRTTLIAGVGALSELPEALEACGCSKPLLITSASIGESRFFGQLKSRLGADKLPCIVDVPKHSSLTRVHAITELARQERVDGLVAVGGGSVIDTAKAVSSFRSPLAQAEICVPVISIPVTPSGAEMNPVYGVFDEPAKKKRIFRDDRVVSRFVLIDPDQVRDVPVDTLLASGMNGLAHCIEALYARRANPLVRAQARYGLKLFEQSLSELITAQGDDAARFNLMLAGHVGGAVLATTGSCLHHAICHVLGAKTLASHGQVNVIMLPHAIEFNLRWMQAEMPEVARELASDLKRVELLRQRIQGPKGLRDLSIRQSDLTELAFLVMAEKGIANNPGPALSAEDVLQVLQAAW